MVPPGVTVVPSQALSQQAFSQQCRLWNQSRSRENSPRRQVSQHEPQEPLQLLSQQSLWNRPRSRSSSRGRQLSQQLFSQAGLHSWTHFGLHSWTHFGLHSLTQVGLHSWAQVGLQDDSQQS
jgi:hypothetical protein